MSAPPPGPGGPKKVPPPGGKAPPGAAGPPGPKKKMSSKSPVTGAKSPVTGKSPSATGKSPVAGKSPAAGGPKVGAPAGPKKAPAPSPDGSKGAPPPAGGTTPTAGKQSPGGKKAPLPPTARPVTADDESAAPAAPVGKKAPAKSKSPVPGSKSPVTAAGKKSPAAMAGKKSPSGKKSPLPPAGGKKSPAGGKSPAGSADGKSPAPAPGGGNKSPMGGKAPPGKKGMPPPGGKMPPGKGLPPLGKKAPSAPGSRAPTPGGGGSEVNPEDLPPPDETPPDSPRDMDPMDGSTPATPPSLLSPTAGAAPASQQNFGTPSQRPGQPQPQDPRQRQGDVSGVSTIHPGGGASPGGQSMMGAQQAAIAAYGAPNAEYLTPAQEARRKLMKNRRANNQQSAKKSTGPLTVDPRSALPIIEFPKERQHAYNNYGADLILHIFLECDRVSSKGKNLRRVAFVTDQTLFLCEEDGGLMRCVQVSKISFINKANDNSNEIALVIPSEYDIVLRMDRKQERDDLLKVLSAVYLRMVSTELNIQTVKEVKPNQYHMDKPAGYQLQRIPQRSRANLQKSLATIEEQQEERNQAILSVQSALEQEHRQQTLNKKGEIQSMQEKLDEATARLKQQQEELEKLRAAFAKCKKRREEIDSQLGAQGQTPMNKDAKIKELAEVVEALTASVQKASEERQRMEAIRRAGDFEVRELDDIDEDVPRLRGRSLHHQGLIEVLQRQVADKNKEISELSKRQMEFQNRQIELKRKQDQLKELEQSLPNYGTSKSDASQFSILGGPTAAEMLDGAGADSSYIRASGDGGRGAIKAGFGDAAYSVPPRYQDPSVSFGTRGGAAASSSGGGLNDSKVFSTPSKDNRFEARDLDVPSTLDEFTEDPRTGLPFVTVQKREQFRWLYDSVLFFFEECSKINKRGRVEKRIMFVTDRELALCNDQGKIRRQLMITDIERITIDENFNVVVHPTDLKSEHDLLVRFKQQKDVELLVKVLRNCSQFLGRNMTVTKIPHIQQNNYKLEKPQNYEGKIDFAAQKRSDLYKIVLGARNRRAKEQLNRDAAQRSEDMEVAERIREDLRGEMALRHEREFLQLRQQLNTIDQNLRDKQNDIRLLHKKIENHKCMVGSTAVATHQPMDLYETHGIYWIPTDPVVMECTMEILHIMFQDNFIVTSHPNGFINVWQISDASLYRTLKTNGHTARVTAFHFDGHDLVSGGHDSSLRRWSITEGLCVRAIHHAHNGPVTGVQFDAFKCVSSGGDGVLNVWDTVSLKKKKTLTGHRSGVVCFKFEGNTLASADWGWVFIWDIDRGLVLKTLRDDNGGIMSLDMCGITLLTGGAGGILSVWNLNTSESEQLDGHTDDIHCVQLQQNFAVSSSSDGSIQMWQVRSMISLGVFHSCVPLECKRFHFKANRFVVGEGNTIKVWTR